MKGQLIHNWEERYRTGDHPWEDSQPSHALVGLVANHAQLSDTLLEVGCGHGHDAVELAKLGHRVLDTDISKTAVGQAFNLAREQGVSLDCLVMDVFNRSLLGQTIDVVYEKGVLHTFFDATSRAAYIDAVSELIPEGGLWISVSGSDQSVDPEDDPDTHAYPRLKLSDIVEPSRAWFEVVEVTQGVYGVGGQRAFKTWNCVMRRRARTVF